MPSYDEAWNRTLSRSFDAALNPLGGNGLTWLPWVGKDYGGSNRRILVVGESHYTNVADAGKVAEEKAKWQANTLVTREVMAEYPLEGYDAGWVNNGGKGNNPTFDNLHRALLLTDLLSPGEEELRSRLWSQLAYYNFVQRVMDYGPGRHKERPTDADLHNGWRVFVELVGILKPEVCLFIGVLASNSFNRCMLAIGVEHTPLNWGDSLNGVYLREGGAVTIQGVRTDLVFMRHSSKYFAWDAWNDYLEKTIPSHMATLRKAVLNS